MAESLITGSSHRELTYIQELNDISAELKNLMFVENKTSQLEAPIFGYLWLNLELAEQLKELGDLLAAVIHRSGSEEKEIILN